MTCEFCNKGWIEHDEGYWMHETNIKCPFGSTMLDTWIVEAVNEVILKTREGKKVNV